MQPLFAWVHHKQTYSPLLFARLCSSASHDWLAADAATTQVTMCWVQMCWNTSLIPWLAPNHSKNGFTDTSNTKHNRHLCSDGIRHPTRHARVPTRGGPSAYIVHKPQPYKNKSKILVSQNIAIHYKTSEMSWFLSISMYMCMKKQLK